MAPHNFLSNDWHLTDWEIPDPGNAGAIPTNRGGVCQLVQTVTTETRTLADPEKVGQLLILTCKTYTDGVTVTAATAVNPTGDNTLAFGAEGQTIMLIGVNITTSGLCWRAVGPMGTDTDHEGPTFSTVA